MMKSKRQIKYGRQLQKDIAEIFQQDPIYFFGDPLVTITHISVSPDLGLAQISLSVFPVASSKKVFERLNEKKGEVRLRLGKKIGSQVRIIPELVFFHDDTEEKASKIDRLIADLDIPPETEV